MRDELRRIRHLPGENLSAERRRIGTSLSRLGERYQWQEIEAPEYHCERLRLHGRLAELPAPADSNVLAFERAASAIIPMAATLRESAPEYKAQIVRHIDERVVIEDGHVVDIAVRLEARPFFDDLRSRALLAPPDGLEPPTQALGRPRSIH